MRSREYLGLLLVLATLSGGCSSRDQRRVENPLNQLRKGEYLREDYIHALCDTLSPLKATRHDTDPQLIVLESDQDGAYLMPIHNFHEGDVPHRVSPEGRLQRILSDPNRVTDTDLSFSAHGAASFSLMKGSSELSFRFVGDAERWVSDSVIAGTYQDATGKKYMFDTNGQAALPDGRRFDYMLATDHVLTRYDYIYSKRLGVTWMAKVGPMALALYETAGDIGETVSPRPKWQLMRLTPPACQ